MQQADRQLQAAQESLAVSMAILPFMPAVVVVA
jgi:hypothetical protein